MADHISSFLGSPRFFNGFLAKNQSDTETYLASPTSVLDTRSSSILLNPFACDRNISKPKPSTPKIPEPKPIGLALIDSINEEKTQTHPSGSFSKPVNRMALFGSKLKIQIPNIGHNESPLESPEGSITRKMMSLEEMELSEDYTCVITHGPNPKTTHIFDNCIVERCTKSADDQMKMECDFETVDFLSFCHGCNDSLGPGRDVYMYRGDKAFCSQECRDQEMLLEEMKNPKMDDDDAFWG